MKAYFALKVAGLACRIQSLPLLYVGYGVLGGIGIGIGYITPISTLIQWFPDRKGLATGIAIMGFGFASLICGPVSQMIMARHGIPAVFYSLAAAYFVLILVSSQFLVAPPPPSQHSRKGSDLSAVEVTEPTPKEALRSGRFYILWIMFFINITCGIGLLSVASPLAQELTGMAPLSAAAMVGIVGLFNGLGRFGWSGLSDYIGRPSLWITFFAIETVAFLLLGRFHRPLAFQAVLCLIITCYGGGFASMPAFISDLFGPRHVSTLLGLMLTAWSAAGITGPLLISYMRQTTGSYNITFLILAGMLGAGLILACLLKSAKAGQPNRPRSRN